MQRKHSTPRDGEVAGVIAAVEKKRATRQLRDELAWLEGKEALEILDDEAPLNVQSTVKRQSLPPSSICPPPPLLFLGQADSSLEFRGPVRSSEKTEREREIEREGR